MPISNYHSLRTSQGTKKAIAPYWNNYRKGKKIGLGCSFHNLCLELAYSNKKYLYLACPHCLNQEEGYPRANFMTTTYTSGRYYSSHFKRKRGSFEGNVNYAQKEVERGQSNGLLLKNTLEKDLIFQKRKKEEL